MTPVIAKLWVQLSSAVFVLRWRHVNIFEFYFIWYFSAVSLGHFDSPAWKLRGRSLCGSLNPFPDGWWRPKLCLQVRQHVEGQVLVLYSDFGFRKQKLLSSMPRLYKLGDAIEELFNSSLCLHIKYIPLLLLIQWPVNTWFPCGTWSGQKGSFFIPADSLFPGDQVTRGVNSVFIYSSPLTSLLPGV